jgi:hypothetical protein
MPTWPRQRCNSRQIAQLYATDPDAVLSLLADVRHHHDRRSESVIYETLGRLLDPDQLLVWLEESYILLEDHISLEEIALPVVSRLCQQLSDRYMLSQALRLLLVRYPRPPAWEPLLVKALMPWAHDPAVISPLVEALMTDKFSPERLAPLLEIWAADGFDRQQLSSTTWALITHHPTLQFFV